MAEEKRAGVGEDDQPAGSAGDDTPDKDVIENTADDGTGDDTLVGGEGETRQTPEVTPKTIAEFFDNADELEGQDFTDAAVAAGMDPGRAALVRDIFRAGEDGRAPLIERIGEQPPAFRADFKSLLGAMRAAGDEEEARRRVLLTSRSLVRAETKGALRDAETLAAVLLGTGGRPGARFGAGTGGRAAPGLKVLMRHSKRFKNKKQFEETRKRIESGVPLGFKTREQALGFGSSVQGHLKSAGIKKARVAIVGSAVTGRKHRRETGRWDGDPFDAGRKSDFDFAIVSRDLLERAKRLGIRIDKDGGRTGVLNVNNMNALGLGPFQMALEKGIKRDHSFRIYGSANELAKRGPHIYFDD